MKVRGILIFSVLLGVVVLSGCLNQQQEVKESSNQDAIAKSPKLGVIVSLLPQKQFVEKIGGEKFVVTVMVPPGGSPHTYEPTPSQMKSVAKAKMYAKVGSGVEFERAWMDRIISTNTEMVVVDSSNGIKLIEMKEHHHQEDEHHEGDHDHNHQEECSEHEGRWIEEHEECEGIGEETCKDLGGEFDACASACRNDPDAEVCTAQCVLVCSFMDYQDNHAEDEHHMDEHHDHDHSGLDPHIWTSVKNAKVMVENTYSELVKIDPENKQYYLDNKNAYLKELDGLDSKLEATFSGLESKKFMVFHPAWGYLARDYGLTQVPVEQEGKEPSAKELAELIDEAREEDIHVVFASPQFNKDTAGSIAKEIGGTVVLINPLEEDYLSNMKKVSEEIKKAMA